MNRHDNHARLSATLLAMLVIAGCAAPDFHQPEIAGPARFKEADGRGPPPSPALPCASSR